ncbi:MAG TPA: VOC family protein [Gemmatimonadales bacterium]|nr:VOC family protein [Gemmatimonadales bacterium]
MTAPKPSFVECEMMHPSLFVPDVEAAVEFYTTRLGFWMSFAWGEPPTIAGVNLDRIQMFLAKGTPAPTGCRVYFVVGDVDALYAFHRQNGAEILAPPTDQHYGLRDYEIKDLNGYTLGFGQRLWQAEPKLDVERVDVPVRLEKRRAAVLTDLAAAKRMTVGECLEETLLHTFEPLDGGGVASPHSRTDFARIKDLKTKHGLDYDCHASYRFTEK